MSDPSRGGASSKDSTKRQATASKAQSGGDAGGAKIWTVRELLDWTKPFFERKGSTSPRLDAELLLASCLDCDRLKLYLDHDRPLNVQELAAYRALVARRGQGEPVAYLLGYKEFYGHRFSVDRRVLIPRPETERLVDEALSLLKPKPALQPQEGPESESVQEPSPSEAKVDLEIDDDKRAILDLCSGSGCIGISLSLARPELQLTGIEIDPEAAELAKENALKLGAPGYRQRVGDLFDALYPEERFFLLISNPPYVDEQQLPSLAPDLRYEPKQALVAQEAGLALLKKVIDGARTVLRPGGYLLLEHGEEQGQALREAALGRGLTQIRTLRDLAGHERILVAQNPSA